MDKQRRYEVCNIAERLDKIVSELNDLADEEKSAFHFRPVGSQCGVSGQDSRKAVDEMRSAADTIGLEIEKLYQVGERRPKFKIISGG